MSWLYLPPAVLPESRTHACTASRSAPEPEGSTSGLQSHAPGIALFVTSSARPMLRPPSWRGWKTRPWIRHLCGTMLEPSTAARGVERWIFLREATPVSRSRSQANARGSMTPAIYGHTSPGLSPNANPNGFFWKTSQIISTSDIARSEASWKSWATGLRKDSLQRQKSARRTSDNGCLFWPTPNVAGGGNPPEILIRKGNHFIRPSGKKAHLGLDQAVKMWPHHSQWSHHPLWSTPHANCMTGRGNAGREGGQNLQTRAAIWPTPMASDGCKPSAGNRRSADLTHVAAMWMTPTARDHKDGATSLANTPVNGLLGRQVLTTPLRGTDTSHTRRTLNPAFVEALMGWPIGWTGFDSVATAWCLWLRRMRFEFCRLGHCRRMTR